MVAMPALRLSKHGPSFLPIVKHAHNQNHIAVNPIEYPMAPIAEHAHFRHDFGIDGADSGEIEDAVKGPTQSGKIVFGNTGAELGNAEIVDISELGARSSLYVKPQHAAPGPRL